MTLTRSLEAAPTVFERPAGEAPPCHRPDADVLHLRHHRLSQNCHPRLHLSRSATLSPPAGGTTSTPTGCTSPSPTPAGARRSGASCTASGCARRRSSPMTSTGSTRRIFSRCSRKYQITTFCAPPTMYRFFIKEDLSQIRPVLPELLPPSRARRSTPRSSSSGMRPPASS